MRLTEENKRIIAEMRIAGKSYQKIANEVGCSKETVKSYLRRHGIEKTPLMGDENLMYLYCLQCGIKLQQLSKVKRKKFCCDACRMAWWRAHKEYIKRQTVVRTCIFCGKEFEVYEGSTKKYCSTDCYFKDRFKDYTPKAQRNDCGSAAGGEKCATLLDGCLCASCVWFYDGKRHCAGCETSDENL